LPYNKTSGVHLGVCPSCGKQVQEGTSFCPFCGKPLANTVSSPSPQPPQPTYQPTPPPTAPAAPYLRNKTSHVARNVAIVIAVLLVLAVAIIAAIELQTLPNSSSSNGNGNGNLTPVTVNIVNGLITVNAGAYEDYTFTVPSGASNIQVSGSFTASGGSGNDIKVYIFDQTDYINWENGHSASAYYQSGQTTTGSITPRFLRLAHTFSFTIIPFL
jgi:hypothetical protein